MVLRVPALGHPLIDRQHRRLLVLGRRLLVAVRRGYGRGELGALLRLTERHFASEDRLMRASAYPERSGHRSLHQGVLQDMRRMRELLCGDRGVHPSHAVQVISWLGHHADVADRNLVAHLRAGGAVKAPRRPRGSRS